MTFLNRKEQYTVRIKNILWVVPFVCFLLGYYLLSHLTAITSLVTPPLIGQHIHDAITILSDHQLNARILAQKEDSDYAPGTILSQSPQPGQKIKPHQSVFLVVAKKLHYPLAPQLIGLTQQEIQNSAKHNSLRVKFFLLESATPRGQCIAQVPAPNQPLLDQTMIVYISSGASTRRIFPDLKNLPVAQVEQFLAEYGIKPQVFYDSQKVNQADYRVKEQKPLAGSLIDISKPLMVQLSVSAFD